MASYSEQVISGQNAELMLHYMVVRQTRSDFKKPDPEEVKNRISVEK